MSSSEALQKGIRDHLIADPAVFAIVGERIHDGRPSSYPAITFGPFDYQRDDDAESCATGKVYSVQIDGWVRDGDRQRPAAKLGELIEAALHRQAINVSPYRLLRLEVEAVRAFMDPDGQTGHAVVTIEAEIED